MRVLIIKLFVLSWILLLGMFVCSRVLVSSQPKLYKSVIDDVINEVRELFLDEGVDEQVLLELKTVHVSRIVLFFFSVNTRCRWGWTETLQTSSRSS